MFTGLVEKTGVIRKLGRHSGGWRLVIACGPWTDDPVVLGESIAVQGVCLTVDEMDANGFTADLLDETLRRSALGRLGIGSRVNLERALRLGDRLGGHIVSGHVDETGAVASIREVGRDYELTVACTKDFARQCIMKGSVAIDGVIDPAEWDLSGQILSYVVPETQDMQSARVAMMYDAEALYVSGIVRDTSPTIFAPGRCPPIPGFAP